MIYKNMITLISKKYLYTDDNFKITFTLDQKDKISIYNSYGENEFIFKNSSIEIISKFAKAFLEISKFN